MHASSFKIYGLLCRSIYTVKMKVVNILHIIQMCLNNENDKSNKINVCLYISMSERKLRKISHSSEDFVHTLNNLQCNLE